MDMISSGFFNDFPWNWEDEVVDDGLGDKVKQGILAHTLTLARSSRGGGGKKVGGWQQKEEWRSWVARAEVRVVGG
jgi:hypothetical protein